MLIPELFTGIEKVVTASQIYIHPHDEIFEPYPLITHLQDQTFYQRYG